jgi:16S rRNA processing protein RimM
MPRPISGDAKTPQVAGPTRGTLVPIGVIVGPQGVRGELRVKLHNPDSELLEEHPEVILRGPGSQPERPAQIRTTHMHRRGLLLVAIAGCGDRDAAAALRGAELCVARTALPRLPDGEHYLVDLIGLQAQRRDGSVVGTVAETIAYPASQVLRVRTNEGTWEIPWIAPYVVEIKLDAGLVIVDHLEDLEIEPLRRRPSS